MPDPEFTLASGTSSWMQAFAWDPLKDEIFMTRNIRTSNGRQTIKINRLGKADDQGVRRFISSMTLTDAGHGDVLAFSVRGTRFCCGSVGPTTLAAPGKLIWSDSSGGGYLQLVHPSASIQDHAEVRHHAKRAGQA